MADAAARRIPRSLSRHPHHADHHRRRARPRHARGRRRHPAAPADPARPDSAQIVLGAFSRLCLAGLSQAFRHAAHATRISTSTVSFCSAAMCRRILSNRRWLVDVGRDSKSPRPPHLTINNVLGLLRACQRGLGIAMLPDYLVEENGGLVQLFGEANTLALDAFFVYPEELKSVARDSGVSRFPGRQRAALEFLTGGGQKIFGAAIPTGLRIGMADMRHSVLPGAAAARIVRSADAPDRYPPRVAGVQHVPLWSCCRPPRRHTLKPGPTGPGFFGESARPTAPLDAVFARPFLRARFRAPFHPDRYKADDGRPASRRSHLVTAALGHGTIRLGGRWRAAAAQKSGRKPPQFAARRALWQNSHSAYLFGESCWQNPNQRRTIGYGALVLYGTLACGRTFRRRNGEKCQNRPPFGFERARVWRFFW